MASILQNARDNRELAEKTWQAYENSHDKNASMAEFASAVPTALGATALGTAGVLNTLNGGVKQIQSGALKQNLGLMNPVVEPHLILKKKKKYYPEDSNLGSVSGLPSNAYVTVGHCSGYTKFSNIHLEIDGATQEELEMIESLLKGGIII